MFSPCMFFFNSSGAGSSWNFSKKSIKRYYITQWNNILLSWVTARVRIRSLDVWTIPCPARQSNRYFQLSNLHREVELKSLNRESYIADICSMQYVTVNNLRTLSKQVGTVYWQAYALLTDGGFSAKLPIDRLIPIYLSLSSRKHQTATVYWKKL